MENIHVVGTMPNTCPCPQGDGGHGTLYGHSVLRECRAQGADGNIRAPGGRLKGWKEVGWEREGGRERSRKQPAEERNPS